MVVYGMLGSVAFDSFHAVAKAKAEAGELTYVLRHSDCGCSQDACSPARKFNLQGYGVELAIKSIECACRHLAAPQPVLPPLTATATC